MVSPDEMLEIERKFLLSGPPPLDGLAAQCLSQGYLVEMPGRSLRIRRAGDSWTLGLKIVKEHLSRHEFEVTVPAREGEAMLALAMSPPVEKRRYRLPWGENIWEIDVFEGANAGLIMAEIELSHVDESFERPTWLGPEVSDEPCFTNAALARRPFGSWGIDYRALLAGERPAQL